MKFKPVPFFLALGIATALACNGGSGSTPIIAVDPKVRLAYLGSIAGTAALYRVDGTAETLLIAEVPSSVVSGYVEAGPINNYTQPFRLRVKVNNDVVQEREFNLTANSKNTVAAARQFQGLARIQNFPVDQSLVAPNRWTFSVGHMATGYQGNVDVYVIRGEETLQTAGRAFAGVAPFTGTTYRLNDVPGNQIAFCAAGTRQSLLTIPYPTETNVPGRKFTVLLRGTGPTQGGFSTLVIPD